VGCLISSVLPATEIDLSKMPPPATVSVDFRKDIQPILEASCFKCHGPETEKPKGKLRVDTLQAVLKGGENAPDVVPGDLKKSTLLHQVAQIVDEDDWMPPKDNKAKIPPLTKDQVALIRAWIEQGAKWEGHWAYVRPERPAAPEVKNKSWPRNPIDEAKLIERVARLLPKRTASRASDLVGAYRKSREALSLPATNLDLLDAIQGDEMFRIPSVRLAEAQRPHQPHTYMYLFVYESPARRGSLGACHALELPFMFGTLDAPTQDKFAGTGAVVEQLSHNMMDAWLGFTQSGNPGHAGIGEWTAYDANDRATMIFGRSSALERAPFDAERAAWEGVL
jgi:hypothetical protein